jgi:hypothetical protein
MKPKKFKTLTTFLLLLPLCVVFLGAGCEDDGYCGFVEGYVVGSFIADEVNAEGQATGNKTERAYCILLEGNEDQPMDFYTFNFPDTLFAFPDGVISSYNTDNCGPAFFPDSLKHAYKIKFKYQIVDEADKVQFLTGPCFPLGPDFLWEYYGQVIVNETVKN